jgi:hypothetical protein
MLDCMFSGHRTRSAACAAVTALSFGLTALGSLTSAASAPAHMAQASKTRPKKPRKRPIWCGATPVDQICATRGNVSVNDAPVSGRRPTYAPVQSFVHVDQGSLGRASFARQASCELGGSDEPTDIITRFLGGGSKLFFQKQGASRCKVPNGKYWQLSLDCSNDPAAQCPTNITTTTGGSFATHASNPIVVDLCTGTVHVAVSYTHAVTTPNSVATSSASAAASGSAIGSVNGTKLQGHTRIVVFVDEAANSVSVEVSTVAGLGVCADISFSKQRAAFGA